MAHLLNPEGVMDTLRDGTVKSIENFFPIVGSKQTLVLKRAYGTGDRNIDDIGSQRKAKMTGRTWATGVYGDFELVDNKSGKVVDRKNKVKLINLPHITRRYSYIVDGNEYQVDNQWRLMSGVYTRKRADGGLETQFNLAKGRGFRLNFDPAKQSFKLQYGTSNIPLLPVLRALGVSDAKIENKWGKEVFNTGDKEKAKNSLIKLAKSLDAKAKPTTEAEAAQVVRDVYATNELRKDTTNITLGTPFSGVNGDLLLSASTKLLNVHRGVDKVDNRDALQFKELWSVEDFIPERIENSKLRINRKLRNNLDRKSSVASIVTPDVFNVPVKAFFTSTNLSQQPTQANPLDMINGHLRTTLLGPGGISTPNAISFDAKLIDASHVGFLDPVATPEGERTGITLHLGLGVEKKGREASIPVYDTKTGKEVKRTPVQLADSIIAFPDQYSWSGGAPGKGAPIAKDTLVTVSSPKEGDPRMAKVSEVDYILTSPKGLFSLTANMIPFLPSDSPNRAEMATRHLEQAIVLKNREAPLVQTHTGEGDGKQTWEKVVGEFTAHIA